MKRFLAAAFGLLFLGTYSSARAAEIKLVASLPNGVAILGVNGILKPEDGKAFADLTSHYEHASVFFNSPGGAVIAGLQIGQLIRLHHYSTFSPEGAMCASACALAWLAGEPRFLQPGSKIGFHEAFDSRTHEPVVVANALVGAYVSRLGLSDAAVVYVEQSAPENMTWLNTDDAERIGLAVKMLQRSTLQQSSASPKTVVPPSYSRGTSTAYSDPSALPKPGINPEILNARAKNFVQEYFARWSEGNAEALSFFDTAYSQMVTYYGSAVDRSVVMRQKDDYVQRWPIRVYAARAPSVRTDCNTNTSTCLVTGVVDWDCASPMRNARSTGAANFALTISFRDLQPQILSESGSVITRHMQ